MYQWKESTGIAPYFHHLARRGPKGEREPTFKDLSGCPYPDSQDWMPAEPVWALHEVTSLADKKEIEPHKP